jgi:hypothetical protein
LDVRIDVECRTRVDLTPARRAAVEASGSTADPASRRVEIQQVWDARVRTRDHPFREARTFTLAWGASLSTTAALADGDARQTAAEPPISAA